MKKEKLLNFTPNNHTTHPAWLRREKGFSMIPKYIDKKIDKLNSLLVQAYRLKLQIEGWAESKGIDTSDIGWYESVIDDSNAVRGICKESLREYIENNS